MTNTAKRALAGLVAGILAAIAIALVISASHTQRERILPLTQELSRSTELRKELPAQHEARKSERILPLTDALTQREARKQLP